MQNVLPKLSVLASIILLSSCSSLNFGGSSSAPAVVPVTQADADATQGTAPAATPTTPEETATTTTDAGTTSTPVGGGMSASDQDKLSHALDGPIGQPTTWVSETNGTTYTVVPTTKVTINGNPYCRKYNVKTEKGSRSNAYTSTACVSADSSWKVATESGT